MILTVMRSGVYFWLTYTRFFLPNTACGIGRKLISLLNNVDRVIHFTGISIWSSHRIQPKNTSKTFPTSRHRLFFDNRKSAYRAAYVVLWWKLFTNLFFAAGAERVTYPAHVYILYDFLQMLSGVEMMNEPGQLKRPERSAKVIGES